MADTKISNLTALAAAPDSGDFFAIVDTSASATKKLAAAYLPALGGTLAQFAATTSAQLAGVISDETGTDALVFANTPTLVTPILGVATATSINKVAITAPATSATLTIADGKTLTVNDNVTLAGAFTLTIPENLTVAGRGVANTFTAVQVIAGGGTDTVPELRLGPYLSSPYESFGWAIQNNNSDGGVRWLHARYNANIARFGFSNESTGSVTQECLYLHINGHIGAGTGSDNAQLTVDQSDASGAAPVLSLDQADTDQDFIDFVGTSGTGNATNISTDAAGVYAGRMQITVNGTRRWLNFYADA